MKRFNLFQPGSGLLHRLDPRTKVAALVLVFVLVLLFNDPRYLGAVFAVLLLGAISVGRPARALLGFGLALSPILLATMVLWPLFEQSGTTLVRWGWINVSDKGILFALAMTFRISIPVLATLLLFLTTRRRDIVAGLVKLGLPYQAGFGITIAFGLVPTFVGSGQTIVEAQRARGFSFRKGNIFTRLRKSAGLIVPLTIGAIGSMQNLAFSMDARGYGASRERTFLHQPHIVGRDLIALALFVLTLAAAITLRLTGNGSIVSDRL